MPFVRDVTHAFCGAEMIGSNNMRQHEAATNIRQQQYQAATTSGSNNMRQQQHEAATTSGSNNMRQQQHQAATTSGSNNMRQHHAATTSDSTMRASTLGAKAKAKGRTKTCGQ